MQRKNVFYSITKLYDKDIESYFICEKVGVDIYKIVSVKKNYIGVKKNYLIKIIEGGIISYIIYDNFNTEIYDGCSTVYIEKYEIYVNIFNDEIDLLLDKLYKKIKFFEYTKINNNYKKITVYDEIFNSITNLYKSNYYLD